MVEKAIGNDAGRLRGDKNLIMTKADTSPVNDIDNDLAQSMNWLRNLKANIGFTTYRPEESGQVDERNLHRYAIDGYIYKHRVKRPQQELKLVILMDASSSMHISTDIYKIPYTIGQMLPRIPIYSYSGYCEVNIRHHNYDVVRSVHPTGFNTNSGGITSCG